MSSHLQLQSWWSLGDKNRQQVLNLQIDPVQVEYAGSIDRAVAALGNEENQDVAGLTILRSDDVLGFFVLKIRSKAPAWASSDTAVVSAMRVGVRHQGGGVGSQALLAVPQWLTEHWPECTTLALSVDEENVRGIRAYARAGFEDTGRREQGRIGWVRYMKKVLRSGASDA